MQVGVFPRLRYLIIDEINISHASGGVSERGVIMQMVFAVYIVIIAIVLVYYGISILLDRRTKRRHRRSTKDEYYHHNPRKDFFYRWYSGDDI